MEGPTPVSALVHSATMVAAGVYLLARFFPVIEASSTASDLIAWIGAGTAFGAAILAMVQTDIKRVLAYSTISQLAYMMFAIGVGGYAAAVFHLMTHAFFKALLFLGSGSVNHATNTFDMRKMGGLRFAMPITFFTFGIGTLALAGIIPFAGFWSKDEILIEAWAHNKGVFVLGLLAAGLTAAYMVRAVYMTFLGRYRGGEEPEPGGHGGDPSQPHESPNSMTTPLIILAVLASLTGFLTIGGEFQSWVYGALPGEHEGKFHWSWGIFLGSTALCAGQRRRRLAVHAAPRAHSPTWDRQYLAAAGGAPVCQSAVLPRCARRGAAHAPALLPRDRPRRARVRRAHGRRRRQPRLARGHVGLGLGARGAKRLGAGGHDGNRPRRRDHLGRRGAVLEERDGPLVPRAVAVDLPAARRRAADRAAARQAHPDARVLAEHARHAAAAGALDRA